MRLEHLLTQLMRIERDASDYLGSHHNSEFEGKWRNEYGSSMELKINGPDVRGHYTSLVSETGAAISGPVIGFQAGEILSFTVLWPSSPAKITTWVGQLVVDQSKGEDDGEYLETLWQMIVNVNDVRNPESLWTTIHAGSDRFRRCK